MGYEEEWEEEEEEFDDGLPPAENLGDVWEKTPPLAPEVLEGVLREGHIMLLSGDSKAGKSFALIELAWAIASGTEWMGIHCRKGYVLFVNPEIDRASMINRFHDVYNAMRARGLTKESARDNIILWNTRGEYISYEKLCSGLIARRHRRPLVVIIDSIYKFGIVENNAKRMTDFFKFLDKLAEEKPCTVIFCHHHAKGLQGWKRAMDRASGSGVFARDPDAVLDMAELRIGEAEEKEKGSAFRLSFNFRNFRPHRPVNIYFKYPNHYVDETGALDEALEVGCKSDILQEGRKQGAEANHRKKEAAKSSLAINIENAMRAHDGSYADLQTVAESLGKSEKTIRKYIKEKGGYEIKNGKIYIKSADITTEQNPNNREKIGKPQNIHK